MASTTAVAAAVATAANSFIAVSETPGTALTQKQGQGFAGVVTRGHQRVMAKSAL
jgi:hypothetical protein